MQLCIKQKQLKNADLLFQKLSNAPIDHHVRTMIETIPLAIEYGLASVGEYMDKRFL